VASAVEGLSPEAVSVLDARGTLLNRPHHDLNGDQSAEATLEYRQKIENDLLAKVNATLEPLLGADKFKAGVSVDCDFTTGEQSEETVDPTKSVMLTSQKTEEQSGANLASGQPGTASTLRPTSRPGSGGNGLTRRSENMTFQSSRVVRRVTIPEGTIKRLSISVLVDHTVRFEGQGAKMRRVVSPPSGETLKAIHDLVAAATGFSTERGDQLVIEALPFETTVNYQPEPAAPAGKAVDRKVPQWLRPYFEDSTTMLIAGAVGACVVLLALMAAVLLVRGKKATASSPDAIAGAAAGTKAISQADIKNQIEAQMAEQEALQAAMQQQKETELLNSLKIPVATTKKAEVLIKRLQANITKDVEGTANVVRTLLNEADRSTK
jgi:flagellar M-ring protein FliF